MLGEDIGNKHVYNRRDEVMKKNICIENLTDVIESVMEKATETFVEVEKSEVVQGTIGAIEVVNQLSEIPGGVSTIIKIVQKVTSIPDMICMNKIENYCKGLTEIPINKRQKYLKKLGKEKLNKESVFILSVLNRIEENEKIPFFIKLLDVKMDNEIDENEYRRLMIMVDRTMYSDLLCLKDDITNEPVKLEYDFHYGFVASGLLVTAGSELLTFDNREDTGIRFNYTSSAKKLAKILFNVECNMQPSNEGIVIMEKTTEEDICSIVDSLN